MKWRRNEKKEMKKKESIISIEEEMKWHEIMKRREKKEINQWKKWNNRRNEKWKAAIMKKIIKKA